MQTVANTRSLFRPDLLDDPQLRYVLPAAYLTYLRTDAQQGRDAFLRRYRPILEGAFARGDAKTVDPREMVETYLARLQLLVADMNARNVPFFFGTDTAVGGPGWGNPPGLNGYWEMRAWAQAGVPLETIFSAATLENARTFGIAEDVGSVEVGKRADLLLMSEDPLESVSAYESIDLIVLEGQVIDRSSLAAGSADIGAPAGD